MCKTFKKILHCFNNKNNKNDKCVIHNKCNYHWLNFKCTNYIIIIVVIIKQNAFPTTKIEDSNQMWSSDSHMGGGGWNWYFLLKTLILKHSSKI